MAKMEQVVQHLDAAEALLVAMITDGVVATPLEQRQRRVALMDVRDARLGILNTNRRLMAGRRA